MTNYNYIPATPEDRLEMLKAIGVETQEDLFKQIPESLKKNVKLGIPEALSELELEKKMIKLAQKNIGLGKYMSFLGGGNGERYIPAAIDNITSRCEFLTAYTPYQPEISQGTLQAIYEYQSMICSLTGMDTSNASMYDGATATAEAALMACRIKRKQKITLSKTVDPETQQVIQTYLSGADIELKINAMDENCITDINELKNNLNSETAGVIIQMPNFLGNLEEVKKLEQIVHNAGALLIVMLDPISSGLIKPPGSYNADIVVGEGQSLGCCVMYGGPAFGFMACKEKYMRQLPGRLVGATVDNRGNRAFTLTLQAREQHIRREKSTSNICTNQSLNALTASIYLSSLGPQGIKELANICFQRAHYLANKINEIPGFKIETNNFFNSFIIRLPEDITEEEFQNEMHENNILPGINVGNFYNEIPNSVLVTVTENNSIVELYMYINAIKEISNRLGLE